jgi:hypothetical protein
VLSGSRASWLRRMPSRRTERTTVTTYPEATL